VSSIVELERLGVSLGGSLVLDEITIAIDGGEIVGISGTNGTGKTTLLRAMATLISPTSGGGVVLGARLGTTEVYEMRKQVGLISHLPAVIDELTLRENLTHAVRLAGEEVARVDGALRAVGLDAAGHRRASASSFGMLRRTEIARLLILRPRLLLLDEATAGLDVDARTLIDALIDRTIDSGGCVVMVSHDVSHVSRAGTRFLLAAGALVEQA
jgi:ABC-type multidrug transport system ATPase subunit